MSYEPYGPDLDAHITGNCGQDALSPCKRCELRDICHRHRTPLDCGMADDTATLAFEPDDEHRDMEAGE